jgi:hypothetical protein
MDSVGIPASKNLHNNGLMHCSKTLFFFGFALEAMASGSVQ